MPSFIWLPSSLAAPVNGAEIPNRTSLLVTPRTVVAPPLGASTVAILAGAALVGCGAVDATGGPAAGGGCGVAEAIGTLLVDGATFVGCRAVDATERVPAGVIARSCVLGASSLASVVKPSILRHVGPSAKYMPIAAPTKAATTTPPKMVNHPARHGSRLTAKISGSSD